ncbi:MAG: hypothetical protein HRT69_16125 [Flavobacteriaceae bacterium]|jgi:hypothetical protein|nr:hypothetical protein [Flavobacteriaceae bacterium]
MESTVYYWNGEENKKTNLDDMVKSDLKSALKEMIKLSSLDQSSKSRYELGSIERQFSEVMLDFHAPEDEPQ